MTKDEIISVIREQLPDIIVKDAIIGDFRFNYGFNEYSIWGEKELSYCDLDKNENVDIPLATMTREQLDEVITKAKKWADQLDAVRRGKAPYKDQIVLIHPDCDEWNVPEFLRDMKYIYGEGDERVGVVSSKDWNLESMDLRDMLAERTGDCFGYDRVSRSELYDWFEDFDVFKQMMEDHPELKGCRIYGTDFD